MNGEQTTTQNGAEYTNMIDANFKGTIAGINFYQTNKIRIVKITPKRKRGKI